MGILRAGTQIKKKVVTCICLRLPSKNKMQDASIFQSSLNVLVTMCYSLVQITHIRSLVFYAVNVAF